jgi:hypothetical protein
MIFRRLAQHLREQNWTAIAIEFVLLIVGVFLGIQVANWNQSLADERLGRAYAQRLTADLERDLATRRELVAYYAAVLESVERTDALLADPQSDPKMLVVDAYRASGDQLQGTFARDMGRSRRVRQRGPAPSGDGGGRCRLLRHRYST